MFNGKQKKPILFKVTEPSSVPYRAPPGGRAPKVQVPVCAVGFKTGRRLKSLNLSESSLNRTVTMLQLNTVTSDLPVHTRVFGGVETDFKYHPVLNRPDPRHESRSKIYTKLNRLDLLTRTNFEVC